MCTSGKNVFTAEGTATAKALRQGCAQCAGPAASSRALQSGSDCVGCFQDFGFMLSGPEGFQQNGGTDIC